MSIERALPPTRFVRKTEDETVNNSETLQDDDHLKLAVAAGEIWFIELFLAMEAASANADWKVGFTGPAGATARWGVYAARGESIVGGIWNVATSTQGQTKAVSISESVPFGSAALTTGAQVAGWFTVGETAGTIQFQWAQNTKTAENNKILKNSFLRATKLA